MMMRTIMKPAFLMVEIAVDLMSIHNSVQNVNALSGEEGKDEILQQYHLKDETNKKTSILDENYPLLHKFTLIFVIICKC